MVKKIVLVTGFLLLIWSSCLIAADEAAAQNCPQDWHPPPCGTPPKPVKPWIQQQIEGLERYHFEAWQIFPLLATATCVGKTGTPSVDAARGAACVMGGVVGGIAFAMQQWEKRLIEEINAARDGGTQEVVMMPLDMASFEFDAEGDPYLIALQDHRDTIEYLGNMIVDSVHTTFECDAWAQYDVRGIECGDNQRQTTEILFSYIGQRYSAVSAIEDYLASQIELVDSDVAQFIDALAYDAQVNGWEGWNFQ